MRLSPKRSSLRPLIRNTLRFSLCLTRLLITFTGCRQLDGECSLGLTAIKLFAQKWLLEFKVANTVVLFIKICES